MKCVLAVVANVQFRIRWYLRSDVDASRTESASERALFTLTVRYDGAVDGAVAGSALTCSSKAPLGKRAPRCHGRQDSTASRDL